MEQSLSLKQQDEVYLTNDSSILNDSKLFLGLTVAGFALSMITTVGNAVLLATIFTESRRLLEKPPSLLITNLCISDLVVGLLAGNLASVLALYRYQSWLVPAKLDVVVRFFLSLLLFVRSGTIVTLSCDRYVVVAHTFTYTWMITKSKYKISIAFMWAVGFILSILQLTSIPEKIVIILYAHTHVSVPAILLTVIYFNVFRALVRRTRELRNVGMINKQVWDKQRSMVVTILLVLTLFYATVLPEFIIVHLRYFCQPCAQSITFKKLEIIFAGLLFLTSGANPFIYAWRLSKYRRAFKTCFAANMQRKTPRPTKRPFNNRATTVAGTIATVQATSLKTFQPS
ncbi:galanin receptor type 1-like [Stylophora pistillata]|uniref:galanin receptor type 1-like n=1 Tax=Stylophora pistillata TaxID=50429 RepID=UPI000C044864|nr:galanin receptor type 1-like [Stylophora pistillata]